MTAESKLLCDVIKVNRCITEARFLVDIFTMKKANKQHMVSKIAIIIREYNNADPFKKIIHCTLLEKS